jgi:hypothetical protein
MHKEIKAFNVKYQSLILSQCKFAHKYNVAASLYIVAAMMMMSALFFRSKTRQIEWNVLANQLTDAINNSMSIKIDDKCHNVASLSKRSKLM